MNAFTSSFQVLLHAFPRWDISTQAATTWAALLSDIEGEHLYAAAVQLARTSKFPPTVAEWRERAEQIAGEGAVSATAAAEGWAEVQRNRQIAAQQRYESRAEKRRPYSWSSAAVQRAAEAVSWNGDWNGEQLGVIRAQFERYLRELISKGDAIQRAHEALEFAPQVEALMGSRALLPRVNADPNTKDLT